MKLGRYKKANLDARYTSYDPEQEFEGDDSLIDLCCPIHGPYQAKSSQLMKMSLRRTLRAPHCQECRRERLSDREYLMQAVFRLKAYRGDKVQQMLNPPHPEWHPLEHWEPINFNVYH